MPKPNLTQYKHAQGLNLPQAAAMLREALGSDAPALVTLKRHAASKQLQFALVRHGARPLYDSAALLKHYQFKNPKASPTHSPDRPSKNEDHLFSKEILDALSEVTRRLSLIENAVVNLDQVRRSLMMKYDDGYTLTTNRLRDLEAENKNLKSGIPLDIAKINQKLSSLQNDISELKEKKS
jgi:hypothetical protein